MEAFKVRLIQEYNELNERIGNGNGATNYVPDWVDMFAKDWFVLGGE